LEPDALLSLRRLRRGGIHILKGRQRKLPSFFYLLVHVKMGTLYSKEENIMTPKTYGYVRVSSTDQNEDRQLIAMRGLSVPGENIFVDKQSGKDFNRPSYVRLIERLKPGDLLYVKSIDRLGRNYEEIQQQWRIITREKKADLCVIDMPLLDTRRGKDLVGTFLSDIVLQVLSFVAENERTNIRARQAEGIAAAKKKGVHLGRPEADIPANFETVCQAWVKGEISLGKAAKACAMPQSTFYRKAKKIRDSAP